MASVRFMDSALKNGELPDKIYESVVRSIYADARSLLVGVLCMAIAPIVLYFKTNDIAQPFFAVLLLGFGLYRIYLAKLFNSQTNNETPRKEFRKWELRYLYASTAYIGLMGCWFIVSLVRSDDKFTALLTLSLTLCYMIGIIGRNFGSARLVIAQIAVASVSIVVGLVASGGAYNFLLAAFLVPFFIAMRIMATRLREMLHSAEINAEESRITANRFDTALENVSHGVVMFDKVGKITVANDRFHALAGMHGESLLGRELSELELANDEFLKRIEKHINSQSHDRFMFETEDFRTIEADYNAMEEGGVVVMSDVTERVASERAIQDLANFDSLTRLRNRRSFMIELERRLVVDDTLSPCTMLFVDLDRFKEVNDTMGHAMGDKLLMAVADRFRAIFPSSEMICRFGGDEFLVVMPGELDIEECSALCERVISELDQPFFIDLNNIQISASIGVAMAPRDAQDLETLLQHADVTLYNVKSRSRGSYAYYSSELSEAVQLKRQLETDLRIAIEREELEVHFQPLVNLKQSRITTCEALVRWRHPQHGMISPLKFIGIAEEAGFIGELGELVLRRAIIECRKWPANVEVAVNVSSIQFYKSDVFRTISDMLEETGLDPTRLQIEVTESVMLEDVDEAAHTLDRISELGVKISLDDFGTGFSNLSYLHKLPFDKVKIDRSFIKDGILDKSSFVLLKGVAELIRNLGLSVVLEGIEIEDQLRQIAQCVEVDEVQGFLFSRALPAADILKLLSEDARSYAKFSSEQLKRTRDSADRVIFA